MASDSVPLETLAESPTSEPGPSQAPRAHTLKLYLSIFMAFIFIVSQIFVGNVLPAFGEKAVVGRTPTTWGIMIQATSMVICYAIAKYLISHGVV